VKPDPLDRLSARLFDAARSEAAPRGAEQRALEAAQRERSQRRPANAGPSARRKWLVAGVGVALAAGTALWLRPKEASVGISAEPSRIAHARPERRSASPVETASAPVPALQPMPTPPKPAASGPAAIHSAPVSLTEELSALKVASSALSAGDTQAALAALDHYDRVLKGKKMRAEATLLRIEALSRAGQAEAASALAKRFVEQNPGNPLVDRARSFVHE
jgi:hypothetical protein